MSGKNSRIIVALAVLLVLGGFGTYLRGHQANPDRPADLDKIPINPEGYYGTEHRFDEYAYEILRADTTTLRNYYDNEGNSFWLFIAYFSSQKYGSQIHSPKHCLPGGGFKIMSIEPYNLDLGNGTTILVNRLKIANQRRAELMLYWYQTRSGVISDEFHLKFDLMKNSMMLLPTDAAICRVTMPLPLNGDFDKATEAAVKYIRDFYPYMMSSLPFGD